MDEMRHADDMCMLCGRRKNGEQWEGKFPKDPSEIQNQIMNLEHTHVQLREDEEGILALAEDRDTLCPMCQELMQGITDERGRQELEDRINRQILELEQKMRELTHQPHIR